MTPEQEIIKLREILWLFHGHSGLYGDDGEMQCGECRLDYRRDSIETIEKRLAEMGLERMAEALGGA